MSRRRSRYTREFKEQAVELWRSSGGTIAECARELGIAEGSLGNWIKQFGESEDDTLTDDDMAELERLREENMRLQKENLILKKSVAFWVRESEL